jgi:hypothetical protein
LPNHAIGEAPSFFIAARRRGDIAGSRTGETKKKSGTFAQNTEN